jgi:hypothetical protein
MPHGPLPVGSSLIDPACATLDQHSPRKPPIASGGATKGGRSGDRAAALRPPDLVSITRCLGPATFCSVVAFMNSEPERRFTRARVASLQGAYFPTTGIWPLVSRRTFEQVTGPKVDNWLAQTVGVLVANIGAVLLLGARHRQVGAPLRDSNRWSRRRSELRSLRPFRSFPASCGTSMTTTTTALVISALHTCIATEVQLKGAAGGASVVKQAVSRPLRRTNWIRAQTTTGPKGLNTALHAAHH